MEHEPVLVEEALGFLDGARTLLDATVGLGGHTIAFLDAFSEGTVIGIDRDAEILESTRARLARFSDRARLHHSTFADLGSVLDAEGLETVDAVLFDFGVSSPQLDQPGRGFSFKNDGPLDMRMDRSRGESAADLVNSMREEDLGNLIYELGGERSSRRVAAAIIAERRREPIETTGRLASIVRRAVRGRSRIDASTRTFQALRMAVNDELGQIQAGLAAATERLADGGKLVAISFHSGEDRIVKRFLRAEKLRGQLEVLTKKVVRPTEAERRRNRRARSSKLRAARKNEGENSNA